MDGGGSESEDVVGIDGNRSSDAALQKKRKRRIANKVGDDSLASIGVSDCGPVLKKSREVAKGSTSALSKLLSFNRPTDAITVASKSSRSDSSLDTLQVRANKRAKSASSVLCKMAGKATGTGIRARAGARVGTERGTSAGEVKERSAKSKELDSVTRNLKDHDVR